MAKKHKFPRRRQLRTRLGVPSGPIRRSPLASTDRRDSIEEFVAEQKNRPKLDEDDAMELAWWLHPDLDRLRLSGNLPEELMDGDGNVWNPVMHINMHAIIERQLATNDPDGVVELAIKYEREGKLNSHEIGHVLAAAVGDEMWYTSTNKVLFDANRYFENIRLNYQTFVHAKNGLKDECGATNFGTVGKSLSCFSGNHHNGA